MKTTMKMETAVQMKAEKKVGNLYLYDDIEPDGVDWWTGEKIKSETSANTVEQKISEMGDISELNVYICSRGGDMATGLAIYSQLQRIAVPKTAYIDGVAASIATVIPCACDKIVMYRTGIFMIHNGIMGVRGNAGELRRCADILDTYSAAARQAYVGRCKISEDEITALMDAETFMTADKALEYGFVDEIADKVITADDAPENFLSAGIAMQADMRGICASGVLRDDGIISQIGERLTRIENMLAEKFGGVPEKGAEMPENKGIVPENEEKKPENKGSVPNGKAIEQFLMAFLK